MKKVVKSKSGANIRNFIIIIILLGAIYVVLQIKTAKEERIAKIEEQNEKVISETVRIINPSPEPKRIKPERPSKNITRKSLSEIQQRLISGERPVDEMPKNTVVLNDGKRLILFVKKDLTWSEAQIWAKQYGGQLATIDSRYELEALNGAIPIGEKAWIGAATAGGNKWTWADGSNWRGNLNLEPTDKLSFVQLDSDLSASAKSGIDTGGLLIEWNKNNSESIDTEVQLKRAKRSISKNSKIYPAGSVSMGNRNFYLCPNPMNLEQAKRFARIAGAEIAAPASEDEAAFLKDLITANVPQGQACRLGGIRQDGKWRWLNDEKWDYTTWASGYPKKNNSIIMVSSSDSSWQDASTNDLIPFTLFEWSKDAPSYFELKQLNSKASELITDKSEAYKKEIEANVTLLDEYLLKNLQKLPRERKNPQVREIRKIRSLISNEKIINKSMVQISSIADVQKLLTSAYNKQASIKKDYEDEIEKILSYYQKNLNTIISNYNKSNQISASLRAKRFLENSSKGTDSFINLFYN